MKDRPIPFRPASAACLFGLVEWLLLDLSPEGTGLPAVLLPLLATVGLYGLFGLVMTIAVAAGNRVLRGRARIDPTAATLAALMLLATLPRLGPDLLAVASAFGLAALVGAALLRTIPRFPRLFSGGSWATAAAVAAAIAAIIASLRLEPAPDPAVTEAGASPSVLLVTIDTLRRDHVGAYGSGSARTPTLDALASEGILFRDAVTVSPWTGPSHASILSGLLPETHRARVNGTALPAEVPTLAEDLRARGYETGAFVSGYPLKNDALAVANRFDEFSEGQVDRVWYPLFRYESLTLFRYAQIVVKRLGYELFFKFDRNAGAVNATAIPWLRERTERPFFAWVHYYDPHLPYDPPPEFQTAADRAYRGLATGKWYGTDMAFRTTVASEAGHLEHMISLYDDEVAYVDASIASLVAEASRAAGPRGLLIVVTSDHGEAMGEHGLYFDRDLYDPTLRIPMIVVPPPSSEIAAGAVEPQVRTIDLAPTILELLGFEPGRRFDGRSLVDLMKGGGPLDPVPAIGILDHEEQLPVYSIRQSGWKLIRRSEHWRGMWRFPAVRELYDLESDPGEARNRAGEEPDRLARLEQILDTHVAGEAPPAAELDEEQRRTLRSLGYLQ